MEMRLNLDDYVVNTTRIVKNRNVGIYKTELLNVIDVLETQILNSTMTQEQKDKKVNLLQKLKNNVSNTIKRHMKMFGYNTIEEYNRYTNYLDKKKKLM